MGVIVGVKWGVKSFGLFGGGGGVNTPLEVLYIEFFLTKLQLERIFKSFYLIWKINFQVVLLGEGAGANILLRFALCHHKRVYGLIAVNCVAGPNVGALFDAIKVKFVIYVFKAKLS